MFLVNADEELIWIVACTIYGALGTRKRRKCKVQGRYVFTCVYTETVISIRALIDNYNYYSVDLFIIGPKTLHFGIFEQLCYFKKISIALSAEILYGE